MSMLIVDGRLFRCQHIVRVRYDVEEGPTTVLYGVAGTLAGALFTPWALFGPIWPLKHTLDVHNLPAETWNMIDVYLGSQGTTLAQESDAVHPHLD